MSYDHISKIKNNGTLQITCSLFHFLRIFNVSNKTVKELYAKTMLEERPLTLRSGELCV